MNRSSSLHWIFSWQERIALQLELALFVASFAVIVAVRKLVGAVAALTRLWSEMFREFGALSAAVIASLIMSRIEQAPLALPMGCLFGVYFQDSSGLAASRVFLPSLCC
jgi:hypothetical protein